MKFTRKSFLKTIGAGVASLSVPNIVLSSPKIKADHNLKFGLASYSFRKFSLEDTIKMTHQLNLKHIALKSMHLPTKSSADEIKAMAKKVRDVGIDLYGGGVIYMKSDKEVNNAFEYAKNAGFKVIIGVPNHELLPLVDKKVKEYDIKVAIHNHGPGDKVYPSPDDVYEKVKAFDKRIGLCIDIGHTYRIGQDPAEKAKKYFDRLYDIHLKDVDGLGANGKTLELGRGIMDIPKFLRTINKLNYQGIVSLEYEKDGDAPLPGAAESIGYARGIMATI
ncbi:MAG: sugar phosphate isomerase/epimerase [Flammeovirgaceae bacterium]|nr:sugar phosphate isomerase/epimerase [Flammeovirgaceae bacterium]